MKIEASLLRRVDEAARERFSVLSEAELLESASIALNFLDAGHGRLEEWDSEKGSLADHGARDEWLMNLPGQLARVGLIAEATAIAEGAAAADPGNGQLYLGDLAQALAEAGFGEEAARRAGENLRAYPDQSWVLVTSGFAYAPTDPERAESLFRRAIELAQAENDPTEVDEVYEHYLEFLAGQPGREAHWQATRRELADWKRSRGWVTASMLPTSQAIKPRKVGRNEPCPCGSGRKFKRCCGA